MKLCLQWCTITPHSQRDGARGSQHCTDVSEQSYGRSGSTAIWTRPCVQRTGCHRLQCEHTMNSYMFLSGFHTGFLWGGGDFLYSVPTKKPALNPHSHESQLLYIHTYIHVYYSNLGQSPPCMCVFIHIRLSFRFFHGGGGGGAKGLLGGGAQNFKGGKCPSPPPPERNPAYVYVKSKTVNTVVLTARRVHCHCSSFV